MHFDQLFRKPDFLGAVEGRHIAAVDCAANRVVHFGMPVTQGVGANAHDAHVGKGVTVHIPYGAALGLAEIGRPLFRQEHLRALGQQHVAAGNNLLGSLPEFLTGAHGGSFVAYKGLIGLEQVRPLMLQLKYLLPAEMQVRREMLEDTPDDIQIRGLIHCPAQPRQIPGMLHAIRGESTRFAQIGRHVFMVKRLVGLPGAALERSDAEHFDIQPVGVSRRRDITEIVRACCAITAHRLVDQNRINQRTITGNPDYRVCIALRCRLQKTAQHIIFTALHAAIAKIAHMLHEALVARLDRCRQHYLVDLFGP